MQKGEFGPEKAALDYVNFVRNCFRTSIDSAGLMQDQGQRVLNLIHKEGEAGYEEWKKILSEWEDNYKKAREQFRSTVEENLAKLEEFLSKK